MSDPEIEDYARVVLLSALSHAGWPEGHHRRSDFLEHMSSALLPSLEKFDPRLSSLTTGSLIEGILQELIGSEALVASKDRFAGEYLTVNPVSIRDYRIARLSSDPIHGMAQAIGFDRFFSDVFAGYRQFPDGDAALPEMLPAPPSDNRLITLQPAQIAKVKAPLDELIAQVEADNGIPEIPGFRERMLGQIKAGREMLLSGCIRAQLFYWVMLKALGELVERYGKKAIGVAASKLIELLLEEVLKR